MSELTPPGFEYMVSVGCSASSVTICSHNAVFRFIWTVESLGVGYWAECGTGNNQYEWKHLEGLSSPVRSHPSWVFRGMVWHQCAEGADCSREMGRGAAGDESRNYISEREG